MSETPVRLSRDALIARFHGYARPRDQFLVGVELERHLLRPTDGTPVPYFGEQGVRWLLEQLGAHGWALYHEGDHPIAADRDGAQVTLEPGSQFELSTAPFPTVDGVAAQSQAFYEEVRALIGGAPLRQVALGFTPFARVEDIAWVPKGRYAVMREYLSATGALAHHMMKGTCAVQASFDFSDEADAAAKVQLGIALGPLTTALYANSPLSGGEPNGYASFRGHIWTATDPRRTGFPEAATAFSFERWVDYLLDVPMMFLKIDGRWRPAHGRSFRDWMAHGIDGRFPGDDDWDLHLTSVFPEVRIKRLIEVRGADCVPMPLAMTLPALFRALFYEPRARDAATAVAGRFASHGTTAERFAIACRHGLAGRIGGARLADWAAEIVTIAGDGLDRLGAGERRWLRPLEQQVATGESPAAAVLAAWRRDPRPEAMVAALDYGG